MLRLRLAWIAIVLVGCSDDGTAGAGETSSASNASTMSAGTMSEGGTSPTGSSGSTSTDPSGQSEGSSMGGSVSTGESSTATATDSATDDATSSGSGSGSGSGSSSTGGEPEFIPCMPASGENCPEGLECFPSECCFGLGFCVQPGGENCGGILGLACDDGQVCVTDLCIADGFGTCVSSDFFDDTCAEQPQCWNGCVPD